jgi:hypothetical protein
LDFDVISSYTDKNVPVVLCELGNMVTFKQDKRILFIGYIFERQKNTVNNLISITCYDRGIYLKRNETTKTFKSASPETITKEICKEFNISMGAIASTGIKIRRNFIGVSLYNIIQTAYTLASLENGKHYLIRFNGLDLTVIEKTKSDETLVIEGGSNLMEASTTESINDMVNQVVIYNDKDVLIATQKDSEMIKLYGQMQSYMKQSEGEDVTNKAKQLIKENGVTQRITVDNLGNIANIAGGTVVVREPYTGIYGLFYIDADIHTWKLGQYYNKLTLNFKNIMDEQEAGSLPNKNGDKTASETLEYLHKPKNNFTNLEV